MRFSSYPCLFQKQIFNVSRYPTWTDKEIMFPHLPIDFYFPNKLTTFIATNKSSHNFYYKH